MANAWHHAVSSARKFGGKPEMYLEIHQWFDNTKSAYADSRHRAIKHHSHGIFWCEERFGPTITVTLDDGRVKQVPTRLVGEQHVIEDCGFIPTIENWLDELPRKEWMIRGAKPLSRTLEADVHGPAADGPT